ncbi:hypothetical protein M406DRAFT_75186 [Cryphonectria parasitica EP155]|uniref:Uncharacterized protein n=1 Tax=Cryphonectria parasitica (strain ATCC 38755 / EP155) TaxID=660469 RepID=A0A9P4XZV5_CRYP1|nr:uncharacterized protein M406DRAFT_75186 [Cryphonectria parasitica EP155]KAF3763961.1 hypothetical protein M406DRAFT_75186 [Cryphonectria parasitica EP155]
MGNSASIEKTRRNSALHRGSLKARQGSCTNDEHQNLNTNCAQSTEPWAQTQTQRKGSVTTTPLSLEAQLRRLRAKLETAKGALDDLDTLAVQYSRPGGITTSVNDAYLSDPSISLAVDRHLTDLDHTASALCKIVTTIPAPVPSDEHSCSSFSWSLDSGFDSVADASRHCDQSPIVSAFERATPVDYQGYDDFDLPPAALCARQCETTHSYGPSIEWPARRPICEKTSSTFPPAAYHNRPTRKAYTRRDSPIIKPFYVAPLRLPSSSPPSVEIPRRRALSGDCGIPAAPFEREIRALTTQINESPLGRMGRAEMTARHIPQSQMSADSHADELPSTPCQEERLRRRPVSLPDSNYASIPTRQFSTEQKTRRLRSMRATSSDDGYYCGNASDMDVRRGQDGSETLNMDELLTFLRDGNSMRDL